MQISRRRKSYQAYKTWLQRGLLAGCMLFAPLANSAMQLVNPAPFESLRSVDIPEGDAWMNARFDIRNNQTITFGVRDPWDLLHQLSLTITYDRFSGIPLTTGNDILTGVDVTIVGAAANILSLNLQKGFKLLSAPRGAGVPTSSNNGNGVFVNGSAPDNSDDRRTFSLILDGDPVYQGDNWSIGFGASWEAPNPALATDYDVIITPRYQTSNAVRITSLTSNPPPPQAAGTTVTFTANAAGGSGSYQYRWWVFDGLVWTLVRDWQAGNTFSWTPSAPNNNYQITAWARNAGQTGDEPRGSASIDYPISGGSNSQVEIDSMTANPAPPQMVGTTINFTANATGGSGSYEYRWWLSDDGGSDWTLFRDWQAGNTFDWTPSTPNAVIW